MNDLSVIDATNAVTAHESELFNSAVSLALKSVSDSSSRVYRDTFTRWTTFCESIACSPLDLTPGKVYAFLEQFKHSKATIQRMLSALRSLTRVLAVIDPQYQRHLEGLKIVNVKQLGTNGTRRDKKALNKREVSRAFDNFLHDTLTDKRDSAILAIAFYAGLRRSEICALKWSDIDLTKGMITIHNGKGKKNSTEVSPVVPLLGDGTALDILKEWKAVSEGRIYVFTRILKGNHFGADKPLTSEVIRRICAKAGDFSPHDARRTMITALLNNGTPLHVAQAQARHASGQTTLQYAKVADAEEIKARAKLDY